MKEINETVAKTSVYFGKFSTKKKHVNYIEWEKKGRCEKKQGELAADYEKCIKNSLTLAFAG